MNFIKDFVFSAFTLLALNITIPKYVFGLEIINCANSKVSQIDSQYIFIGEDHRDFKSKQFIVDYLHHFKSMGFNTIFVEYIESKDQPILNLFNKNPIAYREHVFRTYGQPGDWGYNPTGYLLLTDAIGFYDINIFGLDRRSDLRINMNSDDKMAIRDRHMFDVVKSFIDLNPDEKVIFFNGSSHSFYNRKLTAPSFYEIFKKNFPDAKTTNIKIDFYNFDTVSIERLKISKLNSQLQCPNDYIIYSEEPKSNFDFYLFENTTDFLPNIDYPISIPI